MDEETYEKDQEVYAFDIFAHVWYVSKVFGDDNTHDYEITAKTSGYTKEVFACEISALPNGHAVCPCCGQAVLGMDDE